MGIENAGQDASKEERYEDAKEDRPFRPRLLRQRVLSEQNHRRAHADRRDGYGRRVEAKSVRGPFIDSLDGQQFDGLDPFSRARGIHHHVAGARSFCGLQEPSAGNLPHAG